MPVYRNNKIQVYESGLLFNFSCDFFKLDECEIYRKKSQNSLKAVDFIFLYNKTIFFLEIKNFEQGPADKNNEVDFDKLSGDIYRKILHSLCFTTTIRSDFYHTCQDKVWSNIKNYLPDWDLQILLLIILPEQIRKRTDYLYSLTQKFKLQLKPLKSIFNFSFAFINTEYFQQNSSCLSIEKKKNNLNANHNLIKYCDC